jgi:uncharacterized membrane protein
MRHAKATRLAIIPLALLGLGTSAYLTYEHFSTPLICLGPGCQTVTRSSYSRIFGLPLPILGLLSYGAILWLGIWRFRARSLSSRYPLLGILGLALTGTLFSAYLTYLQFAVLHGLCVWCLISAAAMTAILAAATLDLLTSPSHLEIGPESPDL